MASFDRERWRAVCPYLDRAMEMAPEELDAWLSALRAEQPELAANVEELLADRDAIDRDGFLEAADEAAPSFVRNAVPDPSPRGGPAGPSLSRDLPDSPPQTIGPYRLIRQLGEGGMGIVYLAQQTVPIRREVALKVIKPGLDSEKLLARFLVERQILANLNHAGISKVHDAGVTGDGRPYVAMEYVDGSSLTRYCDEHRLQLGDRLELFLQVCGAIQHAHQKGVIHRDVKPSNLLVTVADGRPLVKVIDFGIAKALQPSPEEAFLTHTGAMLGTPEYMSPEQATLGDVDTRSDVYALGVVLYELLTGVRPFEARDAPRATPLALLEMVRDKDPPRPTTRLRTLQETGNDVASLRGTDLKRLLRQLGGELEWITLKALEKQPSRRYASAAELAADIERHRKDDPVLAGPPSTLYRLGKLASRHRMVVAALSVVAVTILVGAIVTTLSLGRAVRAERLARQELRASLLNQAVTLSNSSELDRRDRALAVLKHAASILPGLDARNAALRSLSTPGFRVIREWSPYVGGAGNVWPDQRLERYARANTDGSISIHAMRDDVELLRLPPVGISAEGGVFSPDGSWLAVEYRGEELRVWNLASRSSRSLVTTLKAVRFTKDSARIIANSETHVHLFDLKSGRELWRRPVARSSDNWLAIHPSGSLFVAPTYGSRKIEIRRTEDGSVYRTLDAPEMGMIAEWSADGGSLITAHMDFSIRVWDWPALGIPRLVLPFHAAETTSLATDPTGRWLATSGWDRQTAFFDLHDGRLLLSQAGSRVYAAADRPSFLWTNATDWKLIAFDPAFALETIRMHETGKGPRRVVFSPDGRLLATAGFDGVRLLDLGSREVLHLLDGKPALCVGFSSDSHLLRAITLGEFCSWRVDSDPPAGRLRAERQPAPVHLEKHTADQTISASISDDGERWSMIAAHAGTKGLSLTHGGFDDSRAERIDGLAAGSSEPQISPDGRWLGWGNWHGLDAVVTRLGGGESPIVFPAGPSARVAFSPDNRTVAVGGARAIRFYETGTWRLLHEIPRVPLSTTPPDFAFTRDSRLCAVSMSDHVLILDTATAEELGTLPADQQTLSSVVFSPDGRYLAAASAGHHVLVWDIPMVRARLRELGLDWASQAASTRGAQEEVPMGR